MTVFPIIIDSIPPYLNENGVPASLLLAPLGTETLLTNLCAQTTAATGETVTVVSTFEAKPAYRQAIRDADLAVDSVVEAKEFGAVLSKFEPSDWLLLVDPLCFAPDGLGLSGLVRTTVGAGWATHLVALDTSSEGTKEYIQLDVDGRVRRIQRYYEGITWLQTSGVLCSLVSVASPVSILKGAGPQLVELRKALAARGVPGRDVSLPGQAIDLSEQWGLRQLAERRVMEVTAQPPPPGYSAMSDRVYLGPNCRIDPSSRIYGPVVIQGDVTIEADATVVGPALVAHGARISRGSVLAQSVVMRDAVVAPEAVYRHAVVSGDTNGHVCGAGQDSVASVPSFQPVPLTCGTKANSFGGHGEARQRSVYPTVKRVVEAVFALLGLIALSPLLMSATLLIRLTSRGPTLYGGKREGKDGVVFKCWKFRTMVEGAHIRQRELYSKNKVDGPQFMLDEDPRVTTVGEWLRRGNIDELPQLINVLLGHMSLIGPRPSPFRENQICVPWRHARLSVRPGITGLWQICRHDRSVGDFHQWIYYDILYVRHMSFWLDIKILIATLVTLGGRRSVPLSWMIPARKLHADGEAKFVPMRTPIARRSESEDAPWRKPSVSQFA